MVPSLQTLRKYGWSAPEWLDRFRIQGGVCPVCKRGPDDGVKFVIDHEHVRHWKHQPPEVRKRYIRGILCSHCNYRLLPHTMTAKKAFAIAHYLAEHDLKRPTGVLSIPKKNRKAKK